MESRSRTAEELWSRLVEEAGESEIERAASVSVAQAERELAQAGFDVAAERARAEAFLDSLEGNAPPRSAGPVLSARAERPGAERRRRVAPLALVGAAAAAAGIAAVAYSAMHDRGGTVARPRPESRPTNAPTTNAPAPDALTAADLRRRAAVACDAGRAKECLGLLDQARVIDAAGDEATDVQKMRAGASQETGSKPR